MVVIQSKMFGFQEKVTEPAPCETTDSSIAAVAAAEDNDPFKKYQEIRHQDFGEIVFRKNKKSKKKANKGILSKFSWQEQLVKT